MSHGAQRSILVRMKKPLALISFLILAGCVSGGKAPSECPRTGFLAEAKETVFFGSATGVKTAEDIAVHAVLTNLEGLCKLRGDQAVVEFSFDAVARKKKGQPIKQQNLSYFVAVLGPDEAILQRDMFYATIDLSGADVNAEREEHKVRIPIAKGADSGQYKVTVGFTLTPEQAAFKQNLLDAKTQP